MKTTETPDPTIQQQLDARQKAITEALDEMVKTIDAYFLVAPMVFMDGCEGAPGQYIFPEDNLTGFSKFMEWIERWMGVLYPRTLESQQVIEKAHPLISNIDTALDIDAAYMDLSYDSLHFGFLLGYLVGCRAKGANMSELVTRASGFTINDIGYNRWFLKSHAKKD